MDIYYTNYAIKNKNVCEKSDWVLNYTNKSFDFAFIGNSRVINMVDIKTIEDKTGKKGINLGLTGANYAENYLVLDQFIKAGNKIKNLVVQIDMHSLKSSTLPYPFHNYNYMHLLGDTTVNNIYKDNNPYYKVLLWRYIPFARYMEFSNRYVFYKMLKGGFECKNNAELDSTKGTEQLFYKEFTPPQNQYAYWSVSPLDKKYLDKLITFSNQKNINIIFYTAPMYYKYFPYQLKLKEILDDFKTNVSGKGISYFNFSNTDNFLCTDLKNYNDQIHMNMDGVRKFSSVISDSLIKSLK